MVDARRVVVVAPDAAVGGRLVAWLAAEGHEARLCTSFTEARPQLDARPPDLLVTELKLGAYNGLHLAIRAKHRRPATSVIVIGERDHVLEREARQYDAEYFAGPLQKGAFTATVRAVLQTDGRNGPQHHHAVA